MTKEGKRRRSWRGMRERGVSVRGRAGVLAAVALTVSCVGPTYAEPTTAQIRQLYTQSRERANQLVKAEKYEEAITIAEDFLRKHPDSGMSARAMAVLVEGILSRHLTDPAKRHEVYQRAYDEFEGATEYYCLGAPGLVRQYLWGQGGVERDAKKAAAMAKEVIEKLDDRLHRDYYLVLPHLRDVGHTVGHGICVMVS